MSSEHGRHHASPNDFHRHRAKSLSRTKSTESAGMTLCGISAEDVSSRTGAATMACFDFAPRPKLMTAIMAFPDGGKKSACGKIQANLHKNQNRQNASTHRPQNIGEIKITEALRALGFLLANIRHHQWKGGPHEHAPGQNGNRQHQRREKQVTHRVALPGGKQEVFSNLEQPGNQDASAANDQFRCAIKINGRQSTGSDKPRHSAPTSPGSQGQAQHENRQNDRENRRNDAEGLERQARPHQLVNQTAKARDKEKQEKNPACKHCRIVGAAS